MSSIFLVFYDCLSKLRAKCIDPTKYKFTHS